MFSGGKAPGPEAARDTSQGHNPGALCGEGEAPQLGLDGCGTVAGGFTPLMGGPFPSMDSSPSMPQGLLSVRLPALP